MIIETVAANLRNTIAGKEAMLKSIKTGTTYGNVMAQMLDINIGELKRILADVESCVEGEME